MFSGPIGELLDRTAAHIDFTPEHEADAARLLDSLRTAGWQVEARDDGLRAVGAAGRAAELNRAAAAAGVTLVRLLEAQDSLEELFLDMTGRTDGELAASRAAARQEKR
ncbi:MAG: hypothetical protein U0838_12810 [Chloroflexota bacterium]